MPRKDAVLAWMALVGCLLAVPGQGCVQPDCSACRESTGAIFDLSCYPSNLTSVVASGPCALPEDSLPIITTTPYAWPTVEVRSAAAGVCHIELTFSTSFTYATDVTFVAQPGPNGCPGCGATFEPTSGPFMVNNPSNTCVAEPDAGDAGGAPESGEGGPSESADSNDEVGPADAPAGG